MKKSGQNFKVNGSDAFYFPSLGTSRVIYQEQIISAINWGNDFNCQSGVVSGCSRLILLELRVCLHCTLCQHISYHTGTPFVCIYLCVFYPAAISVKKPLKCQRKRCGGVLLHMHTEKWIHRAALTHLVLLDIIAGSQVRVSEQCRCPTGNLNLMDKIKIKIIPLFQLMTKIATNNTYQISDNNLWEFQSFLVCYLSHKEFIIRERDGKNRKH